MCCQEVFVHGFVIGSDLTGQCILKALRLISRLEPFQNLATGDITS